MAIKEVYRSKNFDKYLDGRRITNNARKSLFKNVSKINTTARRKYVPVATRATIDSMRMKTISSEEIELSSLNHRNTAGSGIDRYDYKKPNKDYKVRSAKIKAGKNAGKYQWYEKSFEEHQKEFYEDMEGAAHDNL